MNRRGRRGKRIDLNQKISVAFFGVLCVLSGDKIFEEFQP